MACKRCQERPKPRLLTGDMKCGFETGEFSSDNWFCATLDALRGLCTDVDPGAPKMVSGPGIALWHDDEQVALLPAAPFPDGRSSGFVLLRWYNRRGTVDQALMWRMDELPRPLTLAEAEELLDEFHGGSAAGQ